MKGTRVAIRYAKALLATAQEQKAVDQVAQDMEAIFTTLENMYKSLFFKKDQRCCSLNRGDFVEEFQQWIECAEMVIGNSLRQWRQRVVFWDTVRRQPRQYVGKRVCSKSFKTVIMGHQIVFQFTKESLFLRHG